MIHEISPMVSKQANIITISVFFFVAREIHVMMLHQRFNNKKLSFQSICVFMRDYLSIYIMQTILMLIDMNH